MSTILVVDDDLDAREFLGMALRFDGCDVEFSENGNEVLSRIQAGPPDVSLVLLDILMPYKDGYETLEELRRLRPDLPVILLSGALSPADKNKAYERGATDFLAKPVSPETLSMAVRRVLPPVAKYSPEQVSIHEGGPDFLPFKGKWGKKLDLLLERVGSSDVPVLMRGETGVGKEVLARKLCSLSRRSQRPFLKLNCAALPSELVESELFGYERGAFTGAVKSTPGKFEMANRGTILLDEIGDMDFRLQAKLLQVVQDHEFLRLGAKDVTKVDVRVMAATHCDLEKAIHEGRFREDLYYRLNTIDIHIPPLRERQDEILPLAEHFLRVHSGPEREGRAIPAVLQRALLEHSWPGNIRELENLMHKYLVLGNAEIVAEDLSRRARRVFSAIHPVEPGKTPPPAKPEIIAPTEVSKVEEPEPNHSILKNVTNAHRAAEVDAIMNALNETHWNRKQAAALLKIEYKALLYKMKKLGFADKDRANRIEKPLFSR